MTTQYKGDDKYKLKVDIPNFNGDLNIEGLLDRLTKVDRFFDYTELPNDRKVKLVAYRLKWGTSVWWDILREMRMREGRCSTPFSVQPDWRVRTGSGML